MDNNPNRIYYYNDVVLCPKCNCIFKVGNYNKHILTKKHYNNMKRKQYKNQDYIKTGNYIISFS